MDEGGAFGGAERGCAGQVLTASPHGEVVLWRLHHTARLIADPTGGAPARHAAYACPEPASAVAVAVVGGAPAVRRGAWTHATPGRV